MIAASTRFALLLGAAVWLGAPAALADAALTPHSAEYKVKISVLSGRLNTRLAVTDEGYEATYHVEPKGLAAVFTSGEIRTVSAFTETERGLLPIHHVTADSISKKKIQADLDFDWATDTVTGTLNGKAVEIPLDGVVHDFVTLQYVIGRDLQNGGVRDTYIMFEPDELKVLNVTSVGDDVVKVPAGRFEVIGIRHQGEGSSRSTTFWFARELGYLPVVIERHRKGKLQMRAELREYRPEAG
ncbi:MAG: DUF3108 domain-containing protein [Woeseiaceae bacterium]|nr:DUF3108 domain-containing protein [Woeseiaceae bacterium]